MLSSKYLRSAAALVVSTLVVASVAPAFAATSLKVSGSTTLQPLVTQLAAAYHKSHRSVSLTVAGGGSGGGIKDVAAGRVDIGMSSRDLTAAEKASGLAPYEIARDAVAIIVSPKNKYAGSSKATIKKIFSGQITNWRQLGSSFPNKAIVLVGRTGASGTYAFFKEKFLDNGKQSSRTKMYSSNGMVRAAVARDPYAIGYVSMSYINSSVKGLRLGTIAPTKANALSGRYPFVRGLFLVTKGTRAGNARLFMNWCRTSAAQAIAKREYLPLH